MTEGSDFYDFEPHYFEVEGGRIHYVDEGAGPPVLLVHGTPTWSYLYRNLIRVLASTNRVIAADNLGFGRSDKPAGADYRPAAQAANLKALVDSLDLRDLVVAVHDFGGPIGLSYAIERPENVCGLVLFNTWMWSLVDTPAEKMSRLLGGAVGRFLYTRMNFSPRVLLKAAFADKSKLTRDIHRHYLAPFPTPDSRIATWVFARELIGSSDWYEELWRRRDRIADKPALLLWGMKDPAFKPDALARWKSTLVRARAVEFSDAGHFPQEEAHERVATEVQRFLTEVRTA